MLAYFEGKLLCIEYALQELTPSFVKRMARISATLTGKRWNQGLQRWEFLASAYVEINRELHLGIEKDYAKWLEDCDSNRIVDVEIITNNSRSRLVPSSGVEIPDSELEDICSYFVNGYEYTQKFKEGLWDGRDILYRKNTMTFPTGLLQRVVDLLAIKGYNVSIKPETFPPVREYEWEMNEKFKIRPYQEEIIKKAVKDERGVIEMATGAGKTLVAASVVTKIGAKTLFLVHNKTLLYQTISRLKEYITNVEIGQVGDGKFVLKPITVATIQTIRNNLPEYVPTPRIEDDIDEEESLVLKYFPEEEIVLEVSQKDQFRKWISDIGVIIIDECQVVPANLFYNAVQTIPAYHRYGLSATPWRNDGNDIKIEAAIGAKIAKISAKYLIDRGYLVMPIIKFLRVPEKYYRPMEKYESVYRKYVVENPVRNTIIREVVMRELSFPHQVLVLVRYVKHGNILLKNYLPEATFVHGKTKNRQELVQKFKDKEINIMIATTIFDEGLDVPSLDCVILAGGGKSKTRCIQRIGRAIRLHDDCPKCHSTSVKITSAAKDCECENCKHKWSYHGKKNAFIYDFLDQAFAGNKKWLQDHSFTRIRAIQENGTFDTKVSVVAVSFSKG